MTSAGNVRLHTFVANSTLIRFERSGSHFGNRARSVNSLCAFHRKTVPEFVVQPLIAKIALFVGDPFLQPTVRLDDELAHYFLPHLLRSRAPTQRLLAPIGVL